LTGLGCGVRFFCGRRSKGGVCRYVIRPEGAEPSGEVWCAAGDVCLWPADDAP
jgi:hypothetical protein